MNEVVSGVEEADEVVRAEILAVEDARLRALVAVDLETLADLYDDAIVHIHAPGLTHNKAQLLEHVSTRRPYLGTVRGELRIRVLGDVAIMTGPLVNKLRSPDGGERTVGGMVTQVLRRCPDGTWRFLSFQMTPNGEHVWSALPGERAADATTMNEEITR